MINLRNDIKNLIQNRIAEGLAKGAMKLAEEVAAASPVVTGYNRDSVGVAISKAGEGDFGPVTTIGHGTVTAGGGRKPVTSNNRDQIEVIVCTTSEYGGVLDARKKSTKYMTRTWKAKRLEVLRELRGLL